MKQSDKDLILKITKLCLDSTCDTFHPFIDFSPHVNSICVAVHMDGWNGKDKAIYLQAYYPPTSKNLQSVHDDLVGLIKTHDFNYSSEQLEKTASERKAIKIATLKQEIAELEK